MGSCRSWLHEAVLGLKFERILRLVEGGLYVNEKNDRGQTPLLIAVIKGNARIVRLLLSLKADVHAVDRNLITPLHVCAMRNRTDVLIVLLEFGAEVDAVDEKRRTALHIAAEANHVEIAKILIENGASLDFTNEDGDNALFLAVENGCCGIVAKILHRDSKGIIHAKDRWGKTALHVAVAVGNVAAAKALIAAGASKELRDKDNKTPCDYVKNNQDSMKEALASCQPSSAGDVESPDGSGSCMSSMRQAEGTRWSSDSQPSLQTVAPATHTIFQGRCFNDNGLRSSASSHSESISNESTCSLSGLEEWTAGNPFGSRLGILRKLQSLRPGVVLADNFIVRATIVDGKTHIILAQRRFGKREPVIIKFYWDENVYNHVQSVHSDTYASHHICSMIERLKTERTGFPPSIVFEKGSKTLKEWLMTEERSLVDKKWCLRQILLGLKDAHNHGYVHGDLKPSHVMWFSDEARWKLIDWDGARKEGSGTVVSATFRYAAPEVVTPFYYTGALPLARGSLDMWSVGIIAYEILTGAPFFADDASLEDVVKLLLAGEVDKKLRQIQDVTEREALSNFFTVAPGDRWTAADALEHDLFRPDDLTTEIERNSRSGSRSSDVIREHHTMVGLFFLDWLNRRRLSSERH